MLRKCVALVAVVVCAGVLAAGDDDPIRAKLLTAKNAYDAEVRAARKQTEDWFDKREEAARKAGDKKLVDQIKAERTEYEDDGELPKNAPAAIRTRQDKALKALEATYAQAVKDYTKAKKDTEAAAVEAELKNVQARLKAINLLSLVNPKGAALAGEWKKDGKTLTGDKGGKIQLPYEPGDEYDVELTCRRTGGSDGIWLALVVDGRQVLVIIDGWPQSGYFSGLDLIDNKNASENVTAVKGELMKADEDNTIFVSVRVGKIDVTVNGKPAISFKGDTARFSLFDTQTIRNKKALALGFGPESSFKVSRLTVVPVKGKGTVLK